MPDRYSKIDVLFAESDRELLAPILDELRAKGIKVSEAKKGLRKNGIVLVALSETFYENKELTDTLFDLLGKGADNVLPIRLDNTTVPDPVKNALYSRNIIAGAGRDPSQNADRIITALPAKKSVLPMILIATSAVIVIVSGLFIWNAAKPSAEPVETIEIPENFVIPETLSGLTNEDISYISAVTIIGDTFLYSSINEDPVDLYNVAYEAYGDDGVHWYSKKDGHELQMTHYDDLRFLSLMPNLKTLNIVLVDADSSALPNLSDRLMYGYVRISECNIDSLEWLSGSDMEHFTCYRTSVTDFSPLSKCERLIEVNIDLFGITEADFSGFAPPMLKTMRISSGSSLDYLDLSALKDHKKLLTVELSDLPLSDISFLESSINLKNLNMEHMRGMNDISTIENLKNLTDLYIGYSPDITDYSPIAGCTSLRKIRIQGDYNPEAISDASFLEDLPELNDIHLYACNLNDLNFLENIAQRHNEITLGFAGGIRDYSGLSYVKRFNYLHVNPDNGNVSAVLPYLADAEINDLELYACEDLDLNDIPDKIINRLVFTQCDISDLNGLKSYPINSLTLENCYYLSSLDGINNLSELYSVNKPFDLEIKGCERLTDYSALEGACINRFEIKGVYELPDFRSISKINQLKLQNIEGLNDLSILEGANGGYSFDLSLIGLNDLYDLSPLKNLRGTHLVVPPQVADQADELVKSGNYSDFSVEYPDGNWQQYNGEIKLLSLEELDTLPQALLQRIERVFIAGNLLIDMDKGYITQEWIDGSDIPVFYYCSYGEEESERIEITEGTITDLSIFSELVNLKEIKLYAQPITNLNGIQNFLQLESAEFIYCPSLTDASALFACQQLQSISLDGSPVESIQGIQNIYYLTNLNINSTKVTDISPLKNVDYSFAVEQGGFSLFINGTPVEDYSPLSSIPVYRDFDISNADASQYISYLDNSKIYCFNSYNSFKNRNGEDSNAIFTEFIKKHPEIKKLSISWNQELNDLTPVLSLNELEYLRVSFDMDLAIASLNGKEYGFEFEIEGKNNQEE